MYSQVKFKNHLNINNDRYPFAVDQEEELKIN
jgi:hypothetical protein